MSNLGDLKLILDKFEKLIKECPDERNELPNFINYLRAFLRTRDPKFTLPSAEIMTIIKKEKPTIFYLMRKQAASNPSLEILTQLEIDYSKAVERLEDLRSKL